MHDCGGARGGPYEMRSPVGPVSWCVRVGMTASWDTQQNCSVRLERQVTFLDVSVSTHVEHLSAVLHLLGQLEAASGVGRWAALTKGLHGLPPEENSREHRQDGKRLPATFAFRLPPHSRPSFPCSLRFSFSPHGTSLGLCPSVERNLSYAILISCRS